MKLANKLMHWGRALQIRSTLGTKTAAAYLRNRGYSVEDALWMLNRAPRVMA